MLLRPDGDAVIAITQPAHAWVSGQISRAWGGPRGGTFKPREEVCLAAEQHDIGWVEWETEPTLNPRTGLPHTFLQLPTSTHIEIWSRALPWALSMGRYSALLVSMHGTGLYERYGPGPDAPAELRAMVAGYLGRERAAQQWVIDSLSADPRYAAHVEGDAIARNRRLIGAWDYISLVLCGGLDEEKTIPDVPGGPGALDLTLAPSKAGDDVVTVDPWPFAPDAVPLTLEGRRLVGTFDDEETMREAWDGAEWVSLPIELRPA
jgi:hypothetical protein